MAYLGLNALPQFDPATTAWGGAQSMMNFLQNRQNTQAAIQKQQLANQYYPQTQQAAIANTQALTGLANAQASSPANNPAAYSQMLYNNYLNAVKSGDAQAAAMWGGQLNKNNALPNAFGIPGPANGPFNTNPQYYAQSQQPAGNQPSRNVPGGTSGGNGMGIPNNVPVQSTTSVPSAVPAPSYQQNMMPGMGPNQNYGQQAGNNWVPGMMPPAVNPNQAPQSSMWNIMTAHSTPKQEILNNGQTSTVVSAPTTEAQTQQQLRDSSRAELNNLAPIVSSDPYQGNIFQRYSQPISDLSNYFWNYLSGNPQPQDLTRRLSQGYLAGNILPAVGGAGARTDLGSNAGEGAQQKSIDAFGRSILDPNTMLGKIIYNLIPASITTQGGNDLVKAVTNAGDAANKESAIGNPVQIPTNQVAVTGGNPTPYQQQPLSFQQNGQQTSSQQQIKFPSFDNKEDARAWFKDQPYNIQQAYLASLGEK